MLNITLRTNGSTSGSGRERERERERERVGGGEEGRESEMAKVICIVRNVRKINWSWTGHTNRLKVDRRISGVNTFL